MSFTGSTLNAEVTQAELDAKAASSHTHTLSDITDSGTAAPLNVASSGDAASGEVVKGDDSRLTDARTPSSHTHAISEVTNLQTSLDAKQATVTAGDGLSFSGSTLNAEVTQTELDAKIANVSEDTTPQLGGNLDVGSNEINTSTTNGNIALNPDGTGYVEVKGDGTTSGTAGAIMLNCSYNTHGVKIQSPAHSASASYTLTLPVDDGASGEVLSTDGNGVLSWAARSSVSNLDDLSDVNAGSPSDGQVLKWDDNNSEWKPMPDNNSGGGGGSASAAGSTGYLQFNDGSNNFDASSSLVWDDTNNRLGVGTDSSGPSYLVDARTSSGNAQIHLRSGGDLAQLLLISNDTTGTSQINFGDNDANNVGLISYLHNDDALRFTVNSSEQMRIASDGNVGIGTPVPNSYTNYKALTINDTSGSMLDLEVSGTLTGELVAESAQVTLNALTSIPLVFKTANTERLRIDSSGASYFYGQLNVAGGGGSTTNRLNINYNANNGVAEIAPDSNSGNTELKFSTCLSGTKSERMRINSSGKVKFLSGAVGIGGTHTSSGQLDVLGSNTSTDITSVAGAGISLRNTSSTDNNYSFIRFDAASGNVASGISGVTTDQSPTRGELSFATTGSSGYVERMRIDSDGNVGIGTGSSGMTGKLHLSGDFGATETEGLYISNGGTASANDVSPIAFTTRSSGWGTQHAATIAAGTTSTADGGAYLTFKTSTTGQYAPTERMRIKSDGNVGIGEDDPNEPLVVAKSSSGSTAQIVSIVNTAADEDSGARLWMSGTNTTTRGTFIDAVVESTANDHSLRFGTSAGSSAPTERMRIQSDGNVHIGVQEASAPTAGSVDRLSIQPYSNTGGPYQIVARTVDGNTDYLDLKYGSNHVASFGGTTGRIGIGTNVPSNQLEIAGTYPDSGLKITENASGSAAYIRLQGNSSILGGGIVCLNSSGGAGAFVIENGSSESMRIHATGRVTVKKSSNAEVTDLTDGATIDVDLNDSNNFSLTLGGTRTLNNPSNLTAGQSGIITITQDGTGSRALSYGSYWKFSGGTAPTLTTTAGAVDVLAYYVESADRITATIITDTKQTT